MRWRYKGARSPPLRWKRQDSVQRWKRRAMWVWRLSNKERNRLAHATNGNSVAHGRNLTLEMGGRTHARKALTPKEIEEICASALASRGVWIPREFYGRLRQVAAGAGGGGWSSRPSVRAGLATGRPGGSVAGHRARGRRAGAHQRLRHCGKQRGTDPRSAGWSAPTASGTTGPTKKK